MMVVRLRLTRYCHAAAAAATAATAPECMAVPWVPLRGAPDRQADENGGQWRTIARVRSQIFLQAGGTVLGSCSHWTHLRLWVHVG